MPTINRSRRKYLQWLCGSAGLAMLPVARGHHTDTHFDEKSTHQIVYQCNKADPEYFEHILFSVGELIRKYGDDVHVVVACFGKGIHLVGKKPGRPVPKLLQQRAASLAQYGVTFHACGNTMKGLKWTKDDLLPFAKMVPIGVEEIMLLQEQGYSYFSW